MTNKIRYFIANWKMYGDLRSLKTIDNIIKFSKNNKYKNSKIIYCPPYTLLDHFFKKLNKTTIKIGAQNIHENFDYGPHTGFVNSRMIKATGAEYVILGHSENRNLGEDNDIINKKIVSALKSKLKVILCIGETFIQKKKKQTKKVLKKQIQACLKNIKKKK